MPGICIEHLVHDARNRSDPARIAMLQGMSGT